MKLPLISNVRFQCQTRYHFHLVYKLLTSGNSVHHFNSETSKSTKDLWSVFEFEKLLHLSKYGLEMSSYSSNCQGSVEEVQNSKPREVFCKWHFGAHASLAIRLCILLQGACSSAAIQNSILVCCWHVDARLLKHNSAAGGIFAGKPCKEVSHPYRVNQDIQNTSIHINSKNHS